MQEFQLSKFTREGEQLLREVTDEFKRLNLDTSRLPKTFPDDGGKIKLVFVGQYGAGKSSIIKMLTGEDVAIGAGITTQNATAYDWNGLEIVDTPGIDTELRPDHDAITYDQINHAALLVFVVTNEGFSQRMGEHFRKLAVEHKRAANMILVVNKMDRTQLGNVPAQQEIITADLQKVIEPFSPNEMYLSFTDTASYFKALDETDPRRKGRRLERSGIEIFIRNLNRFVADKGVLQKINLPLNVIAAEIRNVNANHDAADFAALKETFRYEQHILQGGKRKCLQDIDEAICVFKAVVSRCGRETAQSVTSQTDEDAAKKFFFDAQNRVRLYAEICAQKISDHIKDFAEAGASDLIAYENSTFVRQVKLNFATHAAQSNQFVHGGAAAVGVGGVAAGAFVFQEGAQIAARFAEVAVTPLGHFVGNVAKVGIGGVLAGQGVPAPVAGLLGDQAGNLLVKLPIFRADPTIANRIAQVFTGHGAKIFGGVMAGVALFGGLFMIHREGKHAQESEQKLHNVREEIISGFDEVADDIARELSSNVRDFMTKHVDPLIANFSKQIRDIDAQACAEDFKRKKLSTLLNRTEKLIAEVQTCK